MNGDLSSGKQTFVPAPLKTGKKLVDKLVGYTEKPMPTFSEEEALGYYSDLEKMGYQEILDWLSGENGPAAQAEGLISQILSGQLYQQPGVRSMFGTAIEAPIMDLLRSQVMPQIAASSGKGGTYFSTMRGQAEIDATQNAVNKISELESGYILNAMNQAMQMGLALPGIKGAAGTGAGQALRQSWKAEQPEYGGGNVPLILQTLQANAPYAQILAQLMTGMQQMSQTEEQMNAAAQTQKASIGNPCACNIFTEGWTKKLEEPVRRFRDEHWTDKSFVSKGYKLMASYIVPKMLRSKLVRTLTRKFMLNPMSKFASLYYKNDPRSVRYVFCGLFWAFVWNMLGRIKTI